MLSCVFEKLIKVSIGEFDINSLYCVSLPGYTWQSGLSYTDIKLQTLQHKAFILLIENIIRGGTSSVVGDRYVDSDDKKTIKCIDANNLYSHSLSQSLPHDEIKFHRNIKIEDIFNGSDEQDNGCFNEVVLKYPDEAKLKTKTFQFVLRTKLVLKIILPNIWKICYKI